jgi:sulfatase modifying factor 1
MKVRLGAVSLLVFALASARGMAAEPTLKIDLGKNVSLEMVLVKKGQFQQGSPESEGGRGKDEQQRTVTLTKSFYMGKYPVTVAQFRRFVEAAGYLTEAEQGDSGGFGLDGKKGLVQRKDFNWKNPGYKVQDDCPVTMLTYDDAFAFVFWLNDKKAGRTFTLPTEAQWEYACRAGTTTPYYSGAEEDDLKDIGWYAGNSDKAAQPVGKKKPNAFGLYDMSGDVFEWCRDWYGPYDDETTDPLQAKSNLSDKPRRVLRGGSWFKAAHFCRSAARYRNDQHSRNADNGFRVEIELADDAAKSEPPRSEGPKAEAPKSDAPKSEPPKADAPKGDAPKKEAPTGERTMLNQGWHVPELRAKGVFPGSPRPSQAQDRAIRIAEFASFEWITAAAPAPRVVKADLFSTLLIVVIIVIVYQIIRTLTSGQTRPPQPPDQPPWPQAPPAPGVPGMRVHVEPAADGFWIDPVGYPPGSVIHYLYHVYGAPHQSTAEVETGGRQFIYTGDPPTDIAIMQIVPPSGMPPMPGQPSVWPIPIPIPMPQHGGVTPGVSGYPTSAPETPVEETTGGGGDFGGETAPSGPSAAEPSAPSAPAGYPSAY